MSEAPATTADTIEPPVRKVGLIKAAGIKVQ